MTLLKGGMFDNSISTLASSAINLTNVFELMEDQDYTVNITFSVFKVKNVIQNITSYGKFNLFFANTASARSFRKAKYILMCILITVELLIHCNCYHY